MAADTTGNPDPGRGPWFRRLLELDNESPLKAVLVTLAVCLVGSVLVAGSAVLLRPLQTANKQQEQQTRIAEIIARLPDAGAHLKAGAALRMETRVIDLGAGRPVSFIDASRYDQRRAAGDPEQSVAIPPPRDLAQIKRRARHAVVYLVRQEGRLQLIILPIHGHGFAGALYGYLGISGDTRTVVGLSFYEHKETPGLGALIDDPAWRAKWRGKMIWNDAGQPALGVAKGAVARTSPEARHLVDGLTGATWTSQGVTNLLRFWLGDDGFGRYLRNLREGGG